MAELVLGLKKNYVCTVGNTHLFSFQILVSLVPPRQCKGCIHIFVLHSPLLHLPIKNVLACSLDLSCIVVGSLEMGAQI